MSVPSLKSLGAVADILIQFGNEAEAAIVAMTDL